MCPIRADGFLGHVKTIGHIVSFQYDTSGSGYIEMTSYLTALLVLTMVVLATVLIPFISIHFFVDEINVIPNGGAIITTTAFRTRLWASLLGLTFIGFPAGKAVSAGDTSVADILSSYGDHWIMYSTIFILLVGLIAGLLARNPHCGAMAAATGFLGCTWLGAYMTPDILTIFLNAQIASVELTNLTSSLIISQLLGGGAGAILSAVMGAIGGALMEQRRNAHRESLGVVNPQVNGRPRLRIAPTLLTANGSRSNEASKWSSCPQCGSKLIWLFEKGQYHCGNCSSLNN